MTAREPLDAGRIFAPDERSLAVMLEAQARKYGAKPLVADPSDSMHAGHGGTHSGHDIANEMGMAGHVHSSMEYADLRHARNQRPRGRYPGPHRLQRAGAGNAECPKHARFPRRVF